MFQLPLLPQNEGNDRDKALALFSLIHGTLESQVCFANIISM